MSILEIGQQIVLTIDDLGSHGEGVGRKDGFTLFVEGALPGESVRVQIVQLQKRYGRGRLVQIETVSPFRIQPPCPLFGKCGGCQFMHLDYSQQLNVKRQRVLDAMVRIGNLTEAKVSPCIPSKHELKYRNKIQLPAKNTPEGIALGLYAVSSHELVPIDSCLIHCSIGDRVYGEISKIIKRSTMMAYDFATGQGELRHVLVKSSVKLNQVLVVLVTGKKKTELLLSIAKEIMAHCPNVRGVVHNINQQNNNVILGQAYHTLEGSGNIEEQLGDLKFKISPASFFQVNPEQALNLYLQALAFANLSGNEIVLDAYCGVGTLSLFFAREAKSVIGVECVPEAISDAKENALLNSIHNVSFVCSSAEKYISTLKAVDIALLNPPRKGCDPLLLKGIGKLAPKKIIYISCDPATLARDLALLCSDGYQVVDIQPFDMFPQTAHVETVVHLCRKKQDINV